LRMSSEELKIERRQTMRQVARELRVTNQKRSDHSAKYEVRRGGQILEVSPSSTEHYSCTSALMGTRQEPMHEFDFHILVNILQSFQSLQLVNFLVSTK